MLDSHQISHPTCDCQMDFELKWFEDRLTVKKRVQSILQLVDWKTADAVLSSSCDSHLCRTRRMYLSLENYNQPAESKLKGFCLCAFDREVG